MPPSSSSSSSSVSVSSSLQRQQQQQQQQGCCCFSSPSCYIFFSSLSQRCKIFCTLYVTWLFVGTMFYAYAPENPLGLAKGFYMAINIGYSIGFGYPTEPYQNYRWFSGIYVVIGASFVAAALGFFVDQVGQDYNGHWFEEQKHRQQYEMELQQLKKNSKQQQIQVQGQGHQQNEPNEEENRDEEENFQNKQLPSSSLSSSGSFSIWEKKLKYWSIQYQTQFRAFAIWFVWMCIMIMYSWIQIDEWTFVDAWYFTISTCSTGGHFPIPADSPNWMYALTGFCAAIGVPLMGLAMATIAQTFINFGDLDDTKQLICETVTKEELEMLQSLGLENGDGIIDKSEFIILCMVRMGGADPELIQFISERFNELDVDKGGSLSVLEITQGNFMMTSDGTIVESIRRPDAAAAPPPPRQKKGDSTNSMIMNNITTTNNNKKIMLQQKQKQFNRRIPKKIRKVAKPIESIPSNNQTIMKSDSV